MLVVDEVDAGKLNLTDEFDITNTYYEYLGEHDNYVAAFGGAMTIPDMQRYSLVYSENKMCIRDRYLASFTSKSLVFGQPSIYFFILLLCLLACLYEMRKVKKWRYLFLLLICSIFALVKHPLENEITIIDIGQGDSILLRDWRGKTILIDTGGKVDFGQKEEWKKRRSTSNAERTLIPYLKSRGIDRIDHMILTHTDTDHMGDLEVLATKVSIQEINISKGSLKKVTFVRLLKRLNLPVKTLEAGDQLSIFDGRAEVLYPVEVGDGSNNDSIVLYGRFYGWSFLFTGDLEEEGEKTLLARYPQLRVDVLKAGHHGSKGSSHPAFLEKIQAKIALISAGEKNRYQHPHQETLERFKELKMTVFRTDQQGAIRFRGWNPVSYTHLKKGFQKVKG